MLDKYEYKLKLEQIKNLVEAKEYKAAAQIADEINWRKVKSIATLCMIAEIYENIKQYEDSRELLLMAYDRSPAGRSIIYRLACVAMKMGDLNEAQEYFEDFIEVAPHDNARYVLRYEIAKAKGASVQELIAILEEFKEREYTEEWAFELAYLYHKAGNVERCVDICDELILWFGEGKYVEKALELKMIYQPLNKLQEDKYLRFKQKKEGIVQVSPYDALRSGEIVRETVTIPKVTQDTMRFNTVNLQAELAKGMQQIMQEESETPVEENRMEEQLNDAQRLEEDVPEAALDINFQEMRNEEPEKQEEPKEQPTRNLQATGQMSIEEILGEWDKRQEKVRTVIAEAEQRRLERERELERQEAEYIMERLSGVIPTGEQIEDMVREELLSETEEDSRTVTEMDTAAEVEFSEDITEMPGEIGLEEQTDAKADNEPVAEADVEQEIIHQQELIQQALEQQIREEEMVKREVTLERVDTEEPAVTELDKEQREIFTYFTLIDGMEAQICQALEGTRQRKRRTQTSVAGNLVITGGRGSGKTVLAQNFVKAYQQLVERENGKLGKISGAKLNQKNISEIMTAVEGGYLIIEKAGDLSRESVTRLSALMEQDTKGLLIILEDDTDGIRKVLARNADFAKKFTERIKVPVFTSDELVAFAKAYAKEYNCEIEEMGVLALYNSISNIERLDEATTLTEVREIMDEAIHRANRGGFLKLFGGKKVTDKGFVLIREKDFNK